MPHPNRIGPAPRSTPAAAGARGAPPVTLPTDLLRDASRRLGVMCLLGAVLWLVGTLLGHVADRQVSGGATPWLAFGTGDAIALASIALSLAVYAYTRRSRRE